MVAFLRPGIGEEQVDRVERVAWDAMAQGSSSVRANDAYISERTLLQFQQQAAHARAVYLYAQVITLRVCAGQLAQGLTVAKPDLQIHRGATFEQLLALQQPALRINSVPGPKLVQRASLRTRHATLASDITADLAHRPGAFGRRDIRPSHVRQTEIPVASLKWQVASEKQALVVPCYLSPADCGWSSEKRPVDG